jgi:hypothetical protein
LAQQYTFIAWLGGIYTIHLKIKVYLSDKKTLHTKNFGIVPGKLLSNGYYIHSNKGKDTIKVGKTSSLSEGKDIFDNHNFEIKSPISKKQKRWLNSIHLLHG